MSLFDLVINIIESSIMCYFIYKYFDFKNIEKLWLFILIDFTSITLCNYFINESSNSFNCGNKCFGCLFKNIW